MSNAAAATREELLSRLCEAAEVEHNLMCVYLYAAFSLKDGEAEGLSPAQAEAVKRWRGAIFGVAREEMVHLLVVSNLLTALGGSAHFGRMNFPLPPGVLPADMMVRLAPFDRDTLQHFVWLERPEGADEAMGAGFEPQRQYKRGVLQADRLMPHAIDYPTVGALYARIEADLETLADRLGEEGLFIGDPDGQIDARFVGLPGVTKVICIKTARTAMQAIVAQGEGAQEQHDSSHYQRFCAIRDEYDALLAADPSFVPSRPAAHNPVMRRSPTPEGKVWIEAATAAAVVDLANALYVHMLRLLIQAFGRSGDVAEKAALIDAAIDLMFAITPVAEHATTLPANGKNDSCNAGMSFATMRSLAPLPYGPAEWQMLAERLDELAVGAARIAGDAPRLQRARDGVRETAARFREKAERFAAMPPVSARAIPATLVLGTHALEAHAPAAGAKALTSTIQNGVERAPGTALTLLFEAKRCIHARFCVTGLPYVFKANVEGPWIDPDAASTEALLGVAHACPSGAIRYERHDGGPDESAPAVNTLRIRENGPYAIHAQIDLAGKGTMFRTTLCRCGASKNKPFCDGSHNDIGFAASGEPATRPSEPLPQRGGLLDIAPQRNGPLVVRGSLEICAGTGRTIDRITGARLCRCGGSKTKPFCDNTHSQNGFEAD
jgi:CDGSH-type Zn-finger protein/uncharacterized Fe-S cluster protein YjdI